MHLSVCFLVGKVGQDSLPGTVLGRDGAQGGDPGRGGRVIPATAVVTVNVRTVLMV